MEDGKVGKGGYAVFRSGVLAASTNLGSSSSELDVVSSFPDSSPISSVPIAVSSAPSASKKPRVQGSGSNEDDDEPASVPNDGEESMSEDMPASQDLLLLEVNSEETGSGKMAEEESDNKDECSKSVLNEKWTTQLTPNEEEGKNDIVLEHTISAELCEQWKWIAPLANFDNQPEIVKSFLQGDLSPLAIRHGDIIDLLVTATKPKATLGTIFPSFLILEYVTKLSRVKDMLAFYEATKVVYLRSTFTNLIKSLVMQKLQQDVANLPPSADIPVIFKANLNFAPVLDKIRYNAWNADYTSVDMTFIKQIERILLEIVATEEIKVSDGTAMRDNKDEKESRVRSFCTSLTKELIRSIISRKFSSTYNVLIRTALEESIGQVAHYLDVESALGAILPLKLHPYNASLHGIAKPVSPDHIKRVKVSASAAEIVTFQELVHTNGVVEDDSVNLHVYEMAKVLGVKDMKKFLFRSRLFSPDVPRPVRKHLLLICTKERFEDLFNIVEDLASWLPSEDKGTLLLDLTVGEVDWLLKGTNIPFKDEMEVYCALVNWALHQQHYQPVVKDRFKWLVFPEVIGSFRMVYTSSLCLLDLADSFESLLQDGFIEREIIVAASKFLEHGNRSFKHPAIRRRE